VNLVKAVGIGVGESVAFVGAGGKTSAMFALASEIEGRVILTATTHLGAWQADLADVHIIIHSPKDLDERLISSGEKILFTGSAGDDDRLHGLDKYAVQKLQDLCKKHNLNLLIEADGARQRPLKAPADYEPVIPEGVDYAVVLAGLSGMGKPLNTNYVHRPQIFSSITGIKENQTISEIDLVRLLESNDGGLKGIAEDCQKILFLNQADDDVLSSKGGRIARQLVGTYDRILVGSLGKTESKGCVQCVYSKTAGVILAAGGSERLEKPKQLLDWRGKPFIRHIAEIALESGLSPLIVITGAFQDQVTEVLVDLPVEIVHNQHWKEGQSTSVRLGVQSLPADCDSVMFLLSDQPQIPSQLILQLLERYRQNRNSITAPMVEGQRGNPLLFSRETFSALASVKGDKGGRAVINQFDVDWLPWIDPRILLDVDKSGDYRKLKEAFFTANDS
jgi:molybdenum cofactor cytidylyltransferase